MHKVKAFVMAYWALILLSMIWGMAFVAIKAVEPDLNPVNITLLRWFLDSLGLAVLAPFFGKFKTKFDRRDVPRFLMVSLANVVLYHLTLNYSESSISAGMAVLLTSLGPVFILILSRIILHEKLGKEMILILVLALSGAAVLSFDADYSSAGGNSFPGILEAIGTAASYSIFAVFSKPLVQKYGALPVTIWVGLTGTAMLFPLLSHGFVAQVASLPIDSWLAMLYLSMVSTVIGYTMFYILSTGERYQDFRYSSTSYHL
ncbi:MAG: DMT family transporter [Candidatus Thermoplasmatota archaeon]|nr:DMT family transporter [Candidatus Thermoplasmatota archaeon]